MSKSTQSWLVPLISVFLGLVAGAIIMLIFGYDPLWAYEELIFSAFGSAYNIGEIFRAMAPLMLIALGFAVSSKAGFFNVGLPGQALMGWTLAAWFAIVTPDLPKVASIPLTVLIGLAAGALAAAIPGILKAYLGTSEVITTIMLNYIILYLSNALLNNHLLPNYADTGAQSVNVSENASYQLPWLSEMFGYSRINLGFLFAIIAVVIIWFILKKTTLGYEITAVGLNPNAAEYAGMSSKKMIVISMAISGALAGLGGAVEGLGTFEYIQRQASSLSIGWNGMAVALLAANSPIGIPFAAFLYAVLEIGKSGMQKIVPTEIIDVVSALIIFFVGIDYIIRRFIKPKKATKVKGGQ